MEGFKPLTPSFRQEINTDFDKTISELQRCEPNALVNVQIEGLRMWKRYIDKLKEWIPVTERLPEDRREVLVTAYWHETYQVMMGSYFGDGLWWCVPFNNTGEHTQKLKPKAWMPLPQPYKAESVEQK